MRFGDFDPDDAFDADDDLIDWTLVAEIARQIERINLIDDGAARLLAARKWAAEVGGQW